MITEEIKEIREKNKAWDGLTETTMEVSRELRELQ